MKCNVCGADNHPGTRFCLNCGAELALFCANCQASLPVEARFCPACGQAVTVPAPLVANKHGERASTSGGELKIVTILFADFAGFTAFVNEANAEEVHELMRSVWAHLDGVISTHGGTVGKHMGDALMALFGDKLTREDAPVQAVRAALAMQDCLGELQRQNPLIPLKLRIGIHTGFIVLEPMSAGEFRATGEAINIASRLEQSAPPSRVLISRDTFRSVYGFFDVQPLPPLVVKGKPEPIQTYLVEVAKARAVARQL